MMQKIIVIGAGKRVQADVLPALHASGVFEVAGIYATSAREIVVGGTSMSIRPLASLTAGDLRRVSWLYLAVPPRTTPDVLELLAKLSVNDINLIIDTPVLLWRQRGAKKHFNKFKRVVVAEDIIHLPWIDTVKEMLGHKITEMIFNQSAYRYHGIALIKELWAVKTFKSVRLTRDKHTSIVLKNNFNHLARIVEPKDYNVGQMTFVGPLGLITDSGDQKNMKPVIQDGALVGIDVLGSTITFSMEERELIGKVTTQSTVTSLTPELKRVGLARMFSKLGQGLKVGKDIDDALSDTRLDEFVHKFGKWINVASFGM